MGCERGSHVPLYITERVVLCRGCRPDKGCRDDGGNSAGRRLEHQVPGSVVRVKGVDGKDSQKGKVFDDRVIGCLGVRDIERGKKGRAGIIPGQHRTPSEARQGGRRLLQWSGLLG